MFLAGFIFCIKFDLVVDVDAWNQIFIGFIFSPRGDKKAICNKFVQTVSKHELLLTQETANVFLSQLLFS